MRRTRKLALTIDVLTSVSRQFRAALENQFYRSALGRGIWHHQQPNGAVKDEVSFDYPPHLRPGNAARGEAWLAGDYSLPGGLMREADAPAFSLTAPNRQWANALHGFDWLQDLMAIDDDAAREQALQHILAWTQADFIWKKQPMAPAVTARRLMSWSAHIPALRPYGDRRQWASIELSMANQARWLYLTMGQVSDGIDRLHAAAGLAFAGLILPQRGDILRAGMEQVSREMRRQILADGGHISRSPQAIAALLADFMALDVGLARRNITPPNGFQETLARMKTMLAMLRHEDGGLACFHGGQHVGGQTLAPLLKGYKAPAIGFARRSGYQKLTAQKTTVLVDVGDAVSGADSIAAHAAPLAFEMSHDKQRVIVNCGPSKTRGEAWSLAARAASAHSTLAFDDGAEAVFLETGLAARRLGPRLLADDWRASNRRVEDPTGVWLEASHGLFAASHGVRHNRRLFMDAQGEDIRGEDLLLPDKASIIRRGAPFHLRFHLHPSVRASLQGGGQSVLLITASGHGWQFRMAGEENTSLQIEDSVYMGESDVPMRCQQIAIGGALSENDTLIRWGLRYAGRTGRRRKAST